MSQPAILYKEFYNKDRGLPEPRWGPPVHLVQCPTCGSRNMSLSASSDDPEEIIGYDTVRCRDCGRITDWYEAHKQRLYHPGDAVRQIIREEIDGQSNFELEERSNGN